MNPFKHFKNSGLALLLLCGLAACKKTEVTPYAKAGESRMLKYQVVNAQDTINGAINQADKTITVYLPGSVFMTLLEPKITVSAGATATPASGTLVEDLVDYFAKGRTITYTVKGADGTSSVYTLKIVSQQDRVTFAEVSPDKDHPLTFNNTNTWYQPDYTVLNATGGTYSLPPFALLNQITKVTLTGADGTVWLFDSVTDSGGGIMLNMQNLHDYAKLPAGLYTITIQYYSLKQTLNNPIKIVYL